ncbi:transposase [Phyllobacterium salinisoli]|uniref:Transposase n=1 Tax=Phyllobacterium salinisoli TaxID=1899321 RepID=A0A368JZH2_9HYPH|nr:transposase [Phyllobacterium salinisoli]
MALFKAMLLSIWYDLSDIKLAEALDNRGPFRGFCGFSASEPTPVRTAFGRDRAGLPIPLRPLHHRRNGNPKAGPQPTGSSLRPEPHVQRATKIIGKRCCHLMLASSPASILNHKIQ